MSIKVTLPLTFPYERRTRAGVTIGRGDTFGGELTAEQVEAFRNDPAFIVEEDEGPEASAKAKSPRKK